MENLSFKISSHLKNIIGRELITDKIIAVFELVKNSYDASATKVDIYFEKNKQIDPPWVIRIVDNGSGMSKDDIINKWLFVAYSEKKEKNNFYIENIVKHQRLYAGAKGVGRFACDRLGKILKLYSKTTMDDQTNELFIQWDKFEKDAETEFIKINIQYNKSSKLTTSGTELVIEGLREGWSREEIMKLKQALSKLISPHKDIENEEGINRFEIYLHNNEELLNDNQLEDPQQKINGKLKNYVFEHLNLKTTHISVNISSDGKSMSTIIEDRGVFLFRVIRENIYPHLKDVSADIYYLNQAAKIQFRKLMSIAPVEFGSIFVYKNGFRIMPYGEPGYDIFQIDRRKAQGYNRYLGTRDIMGKISILGDNTNFIETSSRDGGFVRTPAYYELEDFFTDSVHRVLEKYVVSIIKWGVEPYMDNKLETHIPQDRIRDLVRYVSDSEGHKGKILSFEANPELLDIVSKTQDHSTDDLVKELETLLPSVPDDTTSTAFQKAIKSLKEKQKLSKERNDLHQLLEKTTFERDIIKKQVHFLRHLKTPKYDNAIEALHLINTKALTIGNFIDNILKETNKTDDIMSLNSKNNLYNILSVSKEITTLYNFVFSADYDITKKKQLVFIYEYIRQYVCDFYIPRLGTPLHPNCTHTNPEITKKQVNLNLIKFNMLIENIINNSIKAHAKNITITFSIDNQYITITFYDDGEGELKSIKDLNTIFELGFSTTNGTGLGLAHVKKTIEEMKGFVKAEKCNKGFKLIIGVPYEH